jgi:hypothetical protein
MVEQEAARVPPPSHNYHEQSSGLTAIDLRFGEPVRLMM